MPFTLEQERAYRAVQTGCAWQERTDIGYIEVRGADRYTWLQGMVSQDTRLLEAGVLRLPAYFLNATGHILAELMLINVIGAEPYLLLALAKENVPRTLELLDRFLIMEEVELRDVSGEVICFTLQGAGVGAFLEAQPLFSSVLPLPADYTGYGGVEGYLPTERAAKLRSSLESLGIPHIDPMVAEALRIEAGIPSYPQELNESVIAMEADNAATHISFTKGCYVGQEIIARIDSRGHTNRALTGFIGEEGAILPPNSKLYAEEREVGRITSVLSDSPRYGGKPIGLGYLRHEFREVGTSLTVREAGAEAQVIVANFSLRSE